MFFLHSAIVLCTTCEIYTAVFESRVEAGGSSLNMQMEWLDGNETPRRMWKEGISEEEREIWQGNGGDRVEYHGMG